MTTEVEVKTGQEAENTSEQDAAAAAAAEATAKEAKEKEGEAAPELTPEEKEAQEAQKKHNREQAERRLNAKRVRELEIENARLKGFTEGIQKAGGKTEHADTADAETLYARENPEPKRGQFDDDDEYFRAVRKWDRGLVKFEQEQAQTRTRETQGQAEFARTLEAQRTRGEEKYEDFQDLVSTVDFEPATLQALTASEKGEDIAYYLASNPAELERVGKLNPFLQAKEIGRIEAGLESGKIQIKQTTKAPPPPSTLGGKNNTTVKNIFADNLSTEDRIKMRREQRAARGR